MKHEDALADAGGVLYVLTADSEVSLTRGVRKHKLTSTFVRVEEALWGTWGVANPRRPALPNPTTLVVAPDGTVVFRQTHEEYKLRTPPEGVVERVRASRAKR